MRWTAFVLRLFVAASVFCVVGGQPSIATPPSPHGLLVEMNAMQAIRGGSGMGLRELAPGSRVYRIDLAASEVESMYRRLKQDPGVVSISPLRTYSLRDLPDDPLFGELWGLENNGVFSNTVADADIDAPEAWRVAANAETVVVAVVDSGVDVNHPDLAPHIWTNPNEIPGNDIDDDNNGYIDDIHGWDMGDGNADIAGHAHGTHIAGTIAAVRNNGIGIAGVSDNIRIMGLKVEDSSGWITNASAINALKYVLWMRQNGIPVVAVNASWGGPGEDPLLEKAIQNLADAGVVFVAAAGNSGNHNDLNPDYPGNTKGAGVINVAASTPSDQRAFFSSFGMESVDVGAPGVSIKSTLPSDAHDPPYGFMGGTSMAAPHIAGIVGLTAGVMTEDNAAQRASRLLCAVDEKEGWEEIVAAAGRGNAYESVTGNRVAMVTGADVVAGLFPGATVLVEGFGLGETKGSAFLTDGSQRVPAPVSAWGPTGLTLTIPPSGGPYLCFEDGDKNRIPAAIRLTAWDERKEAPIGKSYALSTAVGDRIYVFGGMIRSGDTLISSKTADVYDVPTDTWTEMGSMPDPQAFGTAAPLDSGILLMGGMDANNGQVLARVRFYDPETGQYTEKKDLPEPLMMARAVNVNGTVYLTGGLSQSKGSQSTLYRYDALADAWELLSPMGGKRFAHGAVAMGGKLYVSGGAEAAYQDLYTNTGLLQEFLLQTVEVYRPETDSWTDLSDLPNPLARMGAASDGETIFLVGGTGRSTHHLRSYHAESWLRGGDAFFTYDPKTDQWEEKKGLDLPGLSAIDPGFFFFSHYGLIRLHGHAGEMPHPRTARWDRFSPDPVTDLSVIKKEEGMFRVSWTSPERDGGWIRVDTTTDGNSWSTGLPQQDTGEVLVPSSLENPVAAIRITALDAYQNASSEKVVTSPNRPPVGSDQNLTMDEDTVFRGKVAATDPDGDELSYGILKPGDHGTVLLDPENPDMVSYQPVKDFHGEDSFQLEARDGFGGRVAISYSVTISPVNDAPVAMEDAFTLTGLNLDLPVLENDRDPEQSPLTIKEFTKPAKGVVTPTDNGFSYRVSAPFVGMDTFTYTISDPEGAVATAGVTITAVGDGDGVAPSEEQGPDGADPEYDGNGDGTPDVLQDQVASLHAAKGDAYVTLASNVKILDIRTESEAVQPSPAQQSLPYGLFDFVLTDLSEGKAQVVLYLPADADVDTYLKYGPTPEDPSPHWYPFSYDGKTGAKIEKTRDKTKVTLYFADGERGDDDLKKDGRIVDIGGPAKTVSSLQDPAPSSGGGESGGGGGGGCFIESMRL